jgi:hypothetical protein
MLFLGWLTLVSFTVGVGEYYNCKYPRVDLQIIVLKKNGEKSIGRTDNGFYYSIYKIYFYIYTYNVCMGSY